MSEPIGDTTRLRRWDVALWGVQILLALFYAAAGLMKLVLPPEALAGMGMALILDLPAGLTRFIALAELAGAVAIVVPAALRILPGLTPLAALGFTLIQILAMGLHALRGEVLVLPVNLMLFGLSILVLWGRLIVVPIRRARR